LYVVKEGAVLLTSSADGANPQTMELKDGGVLNGAAVANGRPHGASAKAAALNTRLLALPYAEVASVLETETEWKRQLAGAGA